MDKENLFYIDARCASEKKDFYIRFDKTVADIWVQTYGEKRKPTTTGGIINTEITKFDVNDALVGSQYACPWCGATGYVRCGVCSKISCYNEKKNNGVFLCSYCGHKGLVNTDYNPDVKFEVGGISGVGQ